MTDFNETPEGKLYKAIWSDEEIIAAQLEQKEELDLARDYRRMSASDFYAKYQLEYAGDVHAFLAKIDAGIETYDWIR